MGQRPRREVLAAGGGMIATSLTGCAGLLGQRKPAVTIPDESLVGREVPIELSDVGDANTLAVTASDGFGREFGRTLAISALEGDDTIPTKAFHDGDAASFVEVAPSSVPGDVTRGLEKDAPPRMLLHHLRPIEDGTPDNFVAVDYGGDLVDDHEVSVAVRGDGETLASATGRRVTVDANVEEEWVTDDDLFGKLALPPSGEPSPGVVVLHGSAANDLSAWSRRLATHGYATLTLQYFGAPGLPETLDDIPLEYFDRAVEWLSRLDAVREDRIGFVGISRGVEAALLTAANVDGETAVVGYGGSGIVSYGLAELGGSGDGQFVEAAGWEAAWTRDGEPIASAKTVQQAVRNAAVEDPEELGTAGIPVEDIGGPVVLYAGRDDQVWPALSYSLYASRRLKHFDFSHPYATIAYEGAGHAFFSPYGMYEAPSGMDHLGGTPEANARAAADSWVRTLDYLEAGLTDP